MPVSHTKLWNVLDEGNDHKHHGSMANCSQVMIIIIVSRFKGKLQATCHEIAAPCMVHEPIRLHYSFST